MDALLENIEVELDRDKRRLLWRNFSIFTHRITRDPALLPANAYILPKWLTGVTPTGHLGTTTLWIENWGVRKCDGARKQIEKGRARLKLDFVSLLSCSQLDLLRGFLLGNIIALTAP